MHKGRGLRSSGDGYVDAILAWREEGGFGKKI